MILGALVTVPDVALAAVVATLGWLFFFCPWPHEGLDDELGAEVYDWDSEGAA